MNLLQQFICHSSTDNDIALLSSYQATYNTAKEKMADIIAEIYILTSFFQTDDNSIFSNCITLRRQAAVARSV
jgi:hypothetical protein